MKKINTLTSTKEDEDKKLLDEITAELQAQEIIRPRIFAQIDVNNTSTQPSINIQNSPFTGLNLESPNDHISLGQQSGANINLTPFQDPIPQRWFVGEPLEATVHNLANSIEYMDSSEEEQEYEKEKPEDATEEEQEYEKEKPEAEEEPVGKKDELEVNDHTTVEETKEEEVLELPLTPEDHFNRARATINNMQAQSEKKVATIQQAANNIILETKGQMQQARDLVAASERSWIANMAENVQQLTSMATHLGNACVTFVTSTTKVMVFVFNNWTGIALALVIIFAGVVASPYILRALARMLKFALTSGFTNNSKGNVLQVPESFIRRLEELSERGGRGNRWYAAGIGVGGSLAFIYKIYRK